MGDAGAELLKFSKDLEKIASKALPDVDKILKKGAQNLKDDLAAGARASKHFKGMARSISYDSRYRVNNPRYEVGPDKNREGGSLGNIFYFGTSRGGGTGDLDTPFQKESTATERELTNLVDKMVNGL